MGLEGEVKLLGPLTMEAIVDAAIAGQLTSNEEATEIIAALYEYAADSSTLAGAPHCSSLGKEIVAKFAGNYR